MIITNKAMLHRWKVRIRRRAIKKVDYIRFWGVMLDDKLNFDRHALYISGKVARAVEGIKSYISLAILSASQSLQFNYLSPLNILYFNMGQARQCWGGKNAKSTKAGNWGDC